MDEKATSYGVSRLDTRSSIPNPSPSLDNDDTISPKEESLSSLTWTTEEETRIRRKLDYHIVPLVTLLYLLCFIDRANVGNARIQGMEKDLGLEGYKFNWALTIFYFTYIL